MKTNLLKTFVLFLLFLSVSSLKSQIFTNNGAVVTLKTGSRMIVNGDVKNAKGNMNIQGSSEFHVHGNFTISADTVRFENSSVGIVLGNMNINTGAFFYRNLGSLSVLGIIFNSGNLYNYGGLIEIGSL